MSPGSTPPDIADGPFIYAIPPCNRCGTGYHLLMCGCEKKYFDGLLLGENRSMSLCFVVGCIAEICLHREFLTGHYIFSNKNNSDSEPESAWGLFFFSIFGGSRALYSGAISLGESRWFVLEDTCNLKIYKLQSSGTNVRAFDGLGRRAEDVFPSESRATVLGPLGGLEL